MSKFRTSAAALQLLQTDFEALSQKLNQPGLSDDQLEKANQTASDLQTRMDNLTAALDDLMRVASETDPDRKVFGNAMVAKVKQLCAQFNEFKDSALNTCRSVSERYQPVLDRKRQEEDLARRNEQEEKERLENERRLAAKAEEDRLRQLEETARQEQAFKAQQDAATNAMERQSYEIQRNIRNVIKSAAAQDELRLVQRREAAKTMPLAEVIDIIECNNPAATYKKALKALQDIVDNIVANPENPQFRTIREANPKLQSDLLSADGGIEAMLSLGFTEKETDSDNAAGSTKEMSLIMTEPPVEDFDRWSAWFEKLQKDQALLQRVYNGLS